MKFYKPKNVWFVYNRKTKEFLLADPRDNNITIFFPVDNFLKKLFVENAIDWRWANLYNIKKSKLNTFLEKYK